MRIPLIVLALIASSAATAEPPKAAPVASSEPQRPAAIVLASADSVHAPVTGNAQSTPTGAKRPVTPRVTSCRCGDPQPDAEPQDE